MTYDHKSFLADYPLTHSEREAIDNANNGNPVKLLVSLTGYLRAISKLRVQTSPCRVSSATGLMHWYRGKIHCLITEITDKGMRKNLTKTFIGGLESCQQTEGN